MLEEIYEWDESLTEDEYYMAIEFLMGDAYPDASEEELEDILGEMLESMPEQYADNILQNIGKVGKGIGQGAMRFVAKNPNLIKGAATIGGSFFGGPMVGGKIGAKVASGLVNAASKKTFLPQTGKALSLFSSPLVGNALSRGTLGIGNGTAPVNLNGQTHMVPLAIIIRSMMYAAQNALKELDQLGVVPPKSLSESMPYADDIDAQAEWLSEQLVA